MIRDTDKPALPLWHFFLWDFHSCTSKQVWHFCDSGSIVKKKSCLSHLVSQSLSQSIKWKLFVDARSGQTPNCSPGLDFITLISNNYTFIGAGQGCRPKRALNIALLDILSGILQAHLLVSLELKGLVHCVRGGFGVKVCIKQGSILVQQTRDISFSGLSQTKILNFFRSWWTLVF